MEKIDLLGSIVLVWGHWWLGLGYRSGAEHFQLAMYSTSDSLNLKGNPDPHALQGNGF